MFTFEPVPPDGPVQMEGHISHSVSVHVPYLQLYYQANESWRL